MLYEPNRIVKELVKSQGGASKEGWWKQPSKLYKWRLVEFGSCFDYFDMPIAKLSTSYGVWRMQSIILDEMYLS